MSSRRFTRLTNGFSKKLENHAAAVSLYVAHYNLCRTDEAHKTAPGRTRPWSSQSRIPSSRRLSTPEASRISFFSRLGSRFSLVRRTDRAQAPEPVAAAPRAFLSVGC